MNAQIQNISTDVVSQFTRAKKAEQAVDQLSLDGFEVISINLNGRAPVIWVTNSERCKALQGVQVGCTPVPGGKLRVFCAPYGHYQVRWQDVVDHE